jgi:hypothetical protein
MVGISQSRSMQSVDDAEGDGTKIGFSRQGLTPRSSIVRCGVFEKFSGDTSRSVAINRWRFRDI